MFGWSYGGYMSAMSVCRSPAGTYACAVAGAPVTSWDGYDTHYTGTSDLCSQFTLVLSMKHPLLIVIFVAVSCHLFLPGDDTAYTVHDSV
jgi:hypothetical protein